MRRISTLLLLPTMTYIASFAYLAWYHHRILLFNTVIHEGGTYTLLQTIFYFSHFLGHIPVMIAISFLFAGTFLSLSPSLPIHSQLPTGRTLAIACLLFLIIAVVGSLAVFGRADTIDFLLQRKQGVNMFVHGGSWLLHLPSTLVLLVLIPVYAFILLRLIRVDIAATKEGFPFILTGMALIILFTAVFFGNPLSALNLVWSDPRYLAHSVRELATFPFTYFPLPIYFLFRNLSQPVILSRERNSRMLLIIIIILSTLTVLAIAYQIYASLAAGVGELAQKPAFTHGSSLSIPYLLASHYFEHVLDSIFFTLVTLLIISISHRQTRHVLKT